MDFHTEPSKVADNTSTNDPLNQTTTTGSSESLPRSVGEEQRNARKRMDRRISQACDRCRLKKTKCTGGKICSRCKGDGAVCVMTSRNKRRDSLIMRPAYVQMVEAQRDRLAMALERFLEEEDEEVSARLKVVLVDMGIELPVLRGFDDPDDSHGAAFEDATQDDQASAMAWDAIFSNLDREEMETMIQISEMDTESGEMQRRTSNDSYIQQSSQFQDWSMPSSSRYGRSG